MPDFERAESVLTDEFFAELERNHKVVLPKHCRNIIRDAMAYEIAERVKNDADQENCEKLLKALTRLLDELEAQRAPETGAFEHFDIRLTRFVHPRGGDSARPIEMFIAGLRNVQEAFARKIPTPPKSDTEKQWLRDLHERLGIARYRRRGAPPKSRHALYSELACVWSEAGQKVTAVKNASRAFVRFVDAVVSKFPELGIDRNLEEDIDHWHRGREPLTNEQREINQRLANGYRDGTLGPYFDDEAKKIGRPWLMTRYGRPARLLYDATEPQGNNHL